MRLEPTERSGACAHVILQIPLQHSALVVQGDPDGKQVAAITAVGATIELTTGKATAAANPIRFITSRLERSDCSTGVICERRADCGNKSAALQASESAVG